ncbi:hypothetical protein CY34DRAFT_19344 [Suillus luteus UH-Slu-Lm8-n1]|uniref:Unplaced genomic scaffold CY34scaffold_1319, whole genome shotgun sequence n=1 Tax=Suillus luteus UH-Slu-Lm8-n1 TaxID=930992 RepID=A0A0D0A1N3_9AGAM|nr:hypothetical protein CY34DRAFT_19344 [Suillus luteus UH-Slu-Lm8-n1]
MAPYSLQFLPVPFAHQFAASDAARAADYTLLFNPICSRSRHHSHSNRNSSHARPDRCNGKGLLGNQGQTSMAGGYGSVYRGQTTTHARTTDYEPGPLPERPAPPFAGPAFHDLITQRKGVWEPLPLIIYGCAVHPLSPSKRDTRLSSHRPLSTITEGSADESGVHRDVVSLEVGDEVYALENIPQEEIKRMAYGTEVCTARLLPVTWSTSSDPTSSSSAKPVKPEELQQVFIGIFPASHIFIRDELSDAEGCLPDLVTSLTAGSSNHNGPSPLALRLLYIPRAYTVPESENMKPLPPRPSLKSGDDTASGAMQPIIDEIASALREWHSMIFQYLARRNYKLFHTVREHIKVLHLGCRQLLAQTLSAEETVCLRMDCIACLVSGNVVQDLASPVFALWVGH